MSFQGAYYPHHSIQSYQHIPPHHAYNISSHTDVHETTPPKEPSIFRRLYDGIAQLFSSNKTSDKRQNTPPYTTYTSTDSRYQTNNSSEPPRSTLTSLLNPQSRSSSYRNRQEENLEKFHDAIYRSHHTIKTSSPHENVETTSFGSLVAVNISKGPRQYLDESTTMDDSKYDHERDHPDHNRNVAQSQFRTRFPHANIASPPQQPSKPHTVNNISPNANIFPHQNAMDEINTQKSFQHFKETCIDIPPPLHSQQQQHHSYLSTESQEKQSESQILSQKSPQHIQQQVLQEPLQQQTQQQQEQLSYQQTNHETVNPQLYPNLAYYLGQIPAKSSGLYLSEIWEQPSLYLEAAHDFIQYLFPLKTRGMNLYQIPLTNDELDLMKTNPKVRENMIKSLDIILHFWGFEMNEIVDENNRINVEISLHHDPKVASQGLSNWMTPNNHNLLRITRVLQCLVLMELELYSLAFLQALFELCKDDAKILSKSQLSTAKLLLSSTFPRDWLPNFSAIPSAQIALKPIYTYCKGHC